jgi:hypothetical protein
MTLESFSREYGELRPSEQGQFADTIRALLANGFVLRDEEADRPHYQFLLRRPEMVRQWLAVAGWQIHHDERLGIVHVRHQAGAHRRRFGKDTTLWLLVVRLVYAEEMESPQLRLTRNPVVMLSRIAERYQAFFPGQAVRRKTQMTEALRTLNATRLIRPAGQSLARSLDPESLWELLPTLEIVLPAADVTAIQAQLATYQQGEKLAATSEDDA